MATSGRIHAWGRNQTLAEYGRQVILLDNSLFPRAPLLLLLTSGTRHVQATAYRAFSTHIDDRVQTPDQILAL